VNVTELGERPGPSEGVRRTSCGETEPCAVEAEPPNLLEMEVPYPVPWGLRPPTLCRTSHLSRNLSLEVAPGAVTMVWKRDLSDESVKPRGAWSPRTWNDTLWMHLECGPNVWNGKVCALRIVPLRA
jgi:hypothetical protein